MNVTWMDGPIGPGWFMMFAPKAVQGVGSTYGFAPQKRFPRPPIEPEKPKPKFRRQKEEDVAVALMLMND